MDQRSYILFISFLVPVTSICRDRNILCDLWHSHGACKLIPEYMQKNCRKRCGFCDLPSDPPKTSTPHPLKPTSPIPETTGCRDEHVSCEGWSKVGECERNKWMHKNCKKSCDLCENQPFEQSIKTTPTPPESADTLETGSMEGKDDDNDFLEEYDEENDESLAESEEGEDETWDDNGGEEKEIPADNNDGGSEQWEEDAETGNDRRNKEDKEKSQTSDDDKNGNETPKMLKCGKRSDKIEAAELSRIVGGRSVGAGRWPWQVGLYWTKYNRRPYCGGTLIKPDKVLTAAHCKPKVGTFVKLGDYDTRYDEGTEHLLSVTKVFLHEKFELATHKNDIALLQLSEPVKLGEAINTVCLPTTTVASGNECYVTGWGHIGVWNFHSATLREAKVPIIDNKYCRIRFQGRVTKKMMCAGYADGGVDACKGDSGGPLVCKNNGKFHLHGIVSWGYGCASAFTPGVYTDVSKYLGWIKRKSKIKVETFTSQKRPLYPFFGQESVILGRRKSGQYSELLG